EQSCYVRTTGQDNAQSGDTNVASLRCTTFLLLLFSWRIGSETRAAPPAVNRPRLAKRTKLSLGKSFRSKNVEILSRSDADALPKMSFWRAKSRVVPDVSWRGSW